MKGRVERKGAARGRDRPYGVPRSGPPPYSVHNQHPAMAVPRNLSDALPTTSTADREPALKTMNAARLTDSASLDESEYSVPIVVGPRSTEGTSVSENWPPILNNEDFEKALLGYGRRRRFMLGLFLLCTSPGILNGFHVMVYVFYGHTPKHWCSIPTLEDANWTPEQIRNVSSPRPEEWSNCEYYDVDYERLRRMGYEKAFQKVSEEERPSTLRCGHFSYEVEQPGTSVVTEWDLVCDRLALKATVQMAVSLGKLLGAFAFGILADKCGRKVSFVIASFIYMVAGPVVALTSLYQVMVAARICLGIAGLGVYESAYSLVFIGNEHSLYLYGPIHRPDFSSVTEICPPELRPTFGILYNHSYPLGILGISAIGYYVRDWRKLQYCISLPALILIVHVWRIPESPRWLYYAGRKRRAWMLVGKFLPPHKERVLRTASTALLLTGAATLFVLLAVPSHMTPYKLAAALLGRLCVSGVFCVTIVHACELFPTTIRNSAIGTSSSWAHVGSTFAPYLVDFFVIYGQWVPSTICGLALFIAALLTQTLPETRGLALYNTLQDFTARCRANPKERVSFGNCILYYWCEKCMNFRNHFT
ncbi:hypothetical protein KM043_002967 [Ampulex compressa]|nr:hypothetical protein KM043_002967 [Ampulex compressa]